MLEGSNLNMNDCKSIIDSKIEDKHLTMSVNI